MTADERMCVGVVLAAGGGSRMGQPKALMGLADGQTLVQAHVHALRTGCHQVVVVLGALADEIGALLPDDVTLVNNAHWEKTELRDSLRMALASLPPESKAVVTPVDCPPIPEAILTQLLAQATPCVLTYEGHAGHPVVVRAGETHDQLAEKTLREILSTPDTVRYPVSWSGCLLNLNTPEDWACWVESQGTL